MAAYALIVRLAALNIKNRVKINFFISSILSGDEGRLRPEFIRNVLRHEREYTAITAVSLQQLL